MGIKKIGKDRFLLGMQLSYDIGKLKYTYIPGKNSLKIAFVGCLRHFLST